MIDRFERINRVDKDVSCMLGFHGAQVGDAHSTLNDKGGIRMRLVGRQAADNS